MPDLATLPKAHLHVHLESTVRPGTLAELADSHGVTLPRKPDAFEGFTQFAAHNGAVRDCLRRPEDFTRVAREFCASQAADGVRYAEVTFTAAAHGERLGDPDMPLQAVLAGLKEGQALTGVECRVLLDHPRRRPAARLKRTLDLARRHPEVVGIGVAGEENHPLAPFADLFGEAADAGIGLVHHAGETCGADSVRDALTTGRADRIGHGIRALEDPSVIAELRDRRIPLEVCPSSNAALGLVESFSSHPLPHLLDAGLVVTLNTDIPDSTGTTLTDEYIRVRETFGYDDTVLATFARNAVDASYASEATKTLLHKDIDAWLTT
ncbi:adenosine deaminase [Lentzea tibetensis]|uniref:Adenosine deaminase n=1 Tax=Lentzea tibetensis TaxID=2591470 RepID=A0A563EQJ4_9PSEU|nr:adenosine deaminase [Lentzea tibetensis]TWP49508.1 adenosine deaminase [Lentzea tibetensis]